MSKDVIKKINQEYIELYNMEELDNDAIFFESRNGHILLRDLENLISEILSMGVQTKVFVSYSKNEKVIPAYIREHERVTLVKVNTYEYKKALVTCKYIVNDGKFCNYFLKKEGQVYAFNNSQLTIKHLFNSDKENLFEQATSMTNILKADIIIHSSEYAKTMFNNVYKIREIWKGKEIVGKLFPGLNEESNDDNKNLSDSSTTIVYHPIYSGSEEEEIQGIRETTEYLRNKYPKFDVILKVDGRIYSKVKDLDLHDVYLTPINELVGMCDVFISDYSTFVFDAIELGKKAIFLNPNYKEDEDKNLLKITKKELDIPVIHDIKELDLENLETKGVMQLPSVKTILSEIILHEKSEFKNHNKQNLLFYIGGFGQNGITSSFINLTNNIDYDKFNVIVVDKSKISNDGYKQVSKLNKNVVFMQRTGKLMYSIDEGIWYRKFMNNEEHKSFELVTQKIYKREFARMFGNLEVDTVIDFSGYQYFWTYLFAFSTIENKLVYQHNNMNLEREKVVNGVKIHEHKIERIEKVYNYFDKVVSVSRETMEENYRNFNKYYNEDQAEFVENYLDAIQLHEDGKKVTPELLTLSSKIHNSKMLIKEEEISRNELFEEFGIGEKVLKMKECIVAGYYGRISPEKGQLNFIEKLPTILEDVPNLIVVVVGDGPQLGKCKNLAKTLMVEDHLIFTGYVENIHSIMKITDCTLLLSSSEGQPMVLLESLAHGIPCIATDIPGNRSVISKYGGKLVSEEYASLNEVLSIKKEKVQFDVNSYNQQINEKLENILCGKVGGEKCKK